MVKKQKPMCRAGLQLCISIELIIINIKEKNQKPMCTRAGLNRRPSAHKTDALPLSYKCINPK